MTREELEEAISCYHTPLYIFDMDELGKTVANFRDGLQGKTDLCFAIKANPFLTEKMSAMVDRIEVCSMGEFRICKALGIPAQQVLISGVLKKEEDIREILAYYGGNCCYTVESLNQFTQFANWSKKDKKELGVYLRLTSGNQFGMDENTIERIIKAREKYPYIKIKGIHFFSGTQKKSVSKIEKELTYLEQFFETLQREWQFVVEELEYGPGMAAYYFTGKEDNTVEDIAEISKIISQMNWKGRIVLEMGRALCAASGYYLTKVCDVKQSGEKNYCIVDGGNHQINYDGQIRGMYQPHLMVSPERNVGEVKNWSICGALCTANDVLVQNIPLKDLQVGDVLIFQRTGAYSMTEGMALFLSHPLPKVVLYENETGFKMARDRQSTYEWNMERKK